MPAASRITLQRGLTRTTGQRAGVPSRVRRARRLRRRGLEASSLLVRELESANGHERSVTKVGFQVRCKRRSVRRAAKSHQEAMIREPCMHCGKQIAKEHSVSLRTVMLLNGLPLDEYVATIVRLEGVPRQLAQEFVDHKMSRNCVKTEPPCPNCGVALQTWHATGCRVCGWRRDANKQLPEYFQGI